MVNDASVNIGVHVTFQTSQLFSSVTQSCPTLCDPIWISACPASLSITNSWCCSNSCPSSQWCHQTILSSVIPFSYCLQSFPASGSFPISWFFTSDGRSIGVSASTSVLPVNIQNWFPWGSTGLISLQSIGLSKVFSNTSSKASVLQHSAFFMVQLSHPYLISGETIALIRQNFVSKVMSLLFNMLSRLVIAFLSRRKHLLISWLQSPSSVILEVPQNKVSHSFHCFPIYLLWNEGTRCHDLSFLNVDF